MRIRSSREGAVLIVVLGILALLTVMAVSFVYSSRLSMRASEAYMRTVNASDISDAAIAEAIAVLEQDRRNRDDDRISSGHPFEIENESHILDDSVDVFLNHVNVDLDSVVVTDSADTTTYTEGTDYTLALRINQGNQVQILRIAAGAISNLDEILIDYSYSYQTHDSLRDNWRRKFSAPVVIAYDDSGGNEGGLQAGDTVYNDTTAVPSTAKVIAIDTNNDLLYLDSTSTALWNDNDQLYEVSGSTFDVVIATNGVSKPDEADLDSDGANESVWQYYYDENGAILGRYAILIQDESSKINVNAAGNLSNRNATPTTFTDDTFSSNEGVTPYEIDLESGLSTSTLNAGRIVLYRHGSPSGAASGGSHNRIFVPGQGDSTVTSGTPGTFDDDDDNYNRYFFKNDGVDNDGDGTVDELNEAASDNISEGLNESDEFRLLRPYDSSPLDYDLSDNDGDTITDETNESNDQPFVTLEQLVDGNGVGALIGTDFLTAQVSTNYDGSTNANRDRRHFTSALSFDRNLNADGGLRTNMNVSTPDQNVATVNAAFPQTGKGDTDAFERHDLRNMQVAPNISDYRDRDNARTAVQDSAGNVFAGVESIRINEVLVRAATNLYEGEGLSGANNWSVASGAPSNLTLLQRQTQGAGSPRGGEDYLTYLDSGSGGSPSPADASTTVTIALPDPPFDNNGGPGNNGNFPFKLRMRVRSNGAGNAADRGFEVYINGSLVNPTSGINSIYGTSATAGRWATFNQGTTAANWYIEEAIAVLTNGNNTMYVLKPSGSAGNLDDVDIDWFYFTQEPDCEWVELVNIGDREVDLNNWKVVSELVKDEDETSTIKYLRESYELTLPDVSILPVDDTSVSDPPYKVFVVDKDISVSADTSVTSDLVANEEISFETSWNFSSYTNVHQFTSIANIYSTWIEFFGNEPFDDINDTTLVGGTNRNVDVGQVSLYDSDGNLVDRVTYDYGNSRAGFRSLQRDHPANPGDRLDTSENFRTRAYSGSNIDPYGGLEGLAVLADGNYDDWLFPWDDEGWSTPTEANNRIDASSSSNRDVRVAEPGCRVKNRLFSSSGEMVRMPFFNEHMAIVGYNEGGSTNDDDLIPGTSVIQNVDKSPYQQATLLSIHTNSGGANAQSGWMVIRGDEDNPVNTWEKNEEIESTTETSFSNVFIDSVKAVDTPQIRELQFFARISYSDGGPNSDDTDPLQPGDTIDYDSGTEEGTAVYVDRDSNFVIVRGDAENLVTNWELGDSIDNNNNFSGTIVGVERVYKEANIRHLADFFTTTMIDLEAGAATVTAGAPTTAYWPDANLDPLVYNVPATSDFDLEWDEDDGVENGTYSLYSYMNYGTDIEDEEAIYVGSYAVTDGTVQLEIENLDAAADTYRFMRAALAPSPQTFGRINVNTASHQVLQGLPGIDSTIATKIINARNMAEFETIGDVYLAVEVDNTINFTPTTFKNISNLITTRSDIYKIIVFGQAANDENRDGIIQESEISSQKKLEMIYQR